MYFIPYKANEFLENSFFQVPKELFVNQYYTDLSLASKVLYRLLLDRLSLSIKNIKTEIFILYFQEKKLRKNLIFQINLLQKHLKN